MLRWVFEDRAGTIVIGQTPNILGLLVVATYAARIGLPRQTRAAPAVWTLGTLSLSLWAFDELLRGANPFRRMGGAVVLGAIVRWNQGHLV